MADSDDIEMVLGDEENASAPNTLDEQQQQQHRDVQVTSPAVMEETIREDDDNDDQQQQQKQQHPSQDDKDLSPTTTTTALGGIVDTPCFCLLDGIIDLTPTTSSNNKDESTTEKQIERLSVPITHLPAVLGRAHQTNDENFIPLGTFTTISRQHCKIEYWCNSTGRLEQQKQQQESKSNDDESNEEASAEFLYVPQKEKGFKFSNKNKKVTDKPFYTITYLGKNRIFVDKEKLEKGETAVLSNGAAIRLSNTCFLYFLLPTKSSTKTLEIIMEPPPPTKKRKTTSSSSSSFTVTSSGLTAKGSSGGGNKSTTAATTTAPKRGRGVSHIQAELDKLSNDELRRQLTAAIQDDIWERRHQLIGSTLSGRAILAVAHDPTLRQKCQRDQGLSRGEIMDWIAASDEFAEWSQQMLNKLEIKSYQSSITKAMIKAGYVFTCVLLLCVYVCVLFVRAREIAFGCLVFMLHRKMYLLFCLVFFFSYTSVVVTLLCYIFLLLAL